MLPCEGGRSCDHWPVPVRLDFSSDLVSGNSECNWPCVVQLYIFLGINIIMALMVASPVILFWFQASVKDGEVQCSQSYSSRVKEWSSEEGFHCCLRS
jgi:hypothetical protein